MKYGPDRVLWYVWPAILVMGAAAILVGRALYFMATGGGP